MQQEKKFDKNQTIAFLLIAILIGVFMYMNSPSEEELETQKKELVEQGAKKVEEEKSKIASQTVFQPSTPAIEETIDVKNDKLAMKFGTKGGQISEIKVLNYTAFDTVKGSNNTPLYLVKDGSNDFNLSFKTKQGTVLNTADLVFSPTIKKSNDETVVTMTAQVQEGLIQFIYTIGKTYGINLDVQSKGLSALTSDKQVALNWKMDGYSSEKGKDQEMYWSHTYYQFKNSKDVEYSLFGADEWEEEEAVSWVANKQQFLLRFYHLMKGLKK